MRHLAPLFALWSLAACGDNGLTINYTNEDPEVSITWPVAGAQLPANSPLTLVALAADPESASDELTVSWTSSLDGPINQGEWSWVGDQVSLATAFGLSEGSHTLTVAVADVDGATASASVDVDAAPILPPAVTFLAPAAPGTVTVRTDERYRLELTVTDDADTPSNLTVEWSGNLAEATTLPPVFNADGTMGVILPNLAAGEYVASISVRDRYGAEGYTQTSLTVIVDDDHDGVALEDDCNDDDPTTYPGATDYCDGVDNDCDGTADNNPPQWYLDADRDGFGTGTAVAACEAPTDHVAQSGDCNDANEDQFPGADEICNGEDDDCNELIDDNAVDATPWYPDADDDNHGQTTAMVLACEAPSDLYIPTAGDCNDGNGTVYQGAPELCDGLDNDCDTQIDESPPTWFVDGDGDGYGLTSTQVLQCDSPGAGYVRQGGDCNDGNGNVNPDATEICNSIDDDCNGTIDDSTTEGIEWYEDLDGDGFGVESEVIVACVQPPNTSERPLDCDDSDPERNPTAPERCNQEDDDCDGFPEVARWVGEGHPYASIQAAINASGLGNLVCIDAGEYAESLNFGGRNITVQGVDRDEVIVNATAGVKFVTNEGPSTTLENVTIRGADTTAARFSALEIRAAHPLIRNVRFTHFRIGTQGQTYDTAAAYIYNSSAVLEDVVIDDIVAWQGANNGGLVTAGILATNWSGSAHGLELSNLNTVPFENSNIYQFAYGRGVALNLTSSSVFLEDLLVHNNHGGSPRGDLGTIYINAGTVTFEHLRLLKNTIDNGSGAGLYLQPESNVSISGGVIAQNVATGPNASGGALTVLGGTLNLRNVDIIDNSVIGTSVGCGGGAIARYGALTTLVNISNTNFVDNTATCGGQSRGAVVWSENTFAVAMSYSNLYNNGASPFTNTSNSTGVGMLAVDPGYRNSFNPNPLLWNLELLSSSPVRNQGQPDVLNPDGTRSHIGSRGGPWATWPSE